jgi:arginine deiminase
VKVVGQIQEPGFLEGGDFFPLGKDLAMVGPASNSPTYVYTHLFCLICTYNGVLIVAPYA